MADQEAIYTKSWRANKPFRWALWSARFFATSATLALLTWLGFILLEPFGLPATYLVVGNPPDYLSGGGQRYRLESTLGSEVPAGGVQPLEKMVKLVAFDSRSKSSTLRNLDKGSLGRINSPNYRQQDVLIVVLSGVGIVADDRLKLRLARDVNSPNATTIDIQSTLDRIRKLQAGLKLLLIDLQPEYYSAPEGQISNSFPESFREQLSFTRDKSMWAICSHSNGEIPRVSTLLDSSHFLLYARNGIAGQADRNSDQRLTVSELYAFLEERFADEDRASGIATGPQTPLLFWGGGSVEKSRAESALLSLCFSSPDFSVQGFIDKYEESLADPEDEPTTQEPAPQREQSDNSESLAEELIGSEAISRAGDAFSATWELIEELLERLNSDSSVVRPMDFPRPWQGFLRRLAELEELYARTPGNGDALAEVLRRARFALQRIASGKRIEEEAFPQLSAISQWTAAQQRLADKSLLNVTSEEAEQIATKFLADMQFENLEHWVSQEEQENVKLEGSPTLELLNSYRKTTELPHSIIRKDIAIQMQVDKLWEDYRELNSHCIAQWGKFQQHQIRARRLLADRVGSQWLQQANLEFSNAQTRLFEISESLATMRETNVMIRRLAFALPEYLRLRGLIGNQPAIRWMDVEQLEQLIQEFGTLQRVMSESPIDVNRLAFSIGKIRSPANRILKKFGKDILTDGDVAEALTVQDLLLLSRSPAFVSRDRAKFFDLARQRELSSWRLLNSPGGADVTSRIFPQIDRYEQLRLEALLASAFVPNPELEEKEALANILEPKQDLSPPLALLAGSAGLLRFYEMSSSRLDRALSESRAIVDSELDFSWRAEFAENMGLARMASFSVAGATTAMELANQLEAVSSREAQLLLMERQAHLLAGARPEEAKAISQAPTPQEPRQIQVSESLLSPGLSARVPAQIAFSCNAARLSFSLYSMAQKEQEVWAILEYAPHEFALNSKGSDPNLHSLYTLRDSINDSSEHDANITLDTSQPPTKAEAIGVLEKSPELTYPFPSEVYELPTIAVLGANQTETCNFNIEKLTGNTNSDLVLHVLTRDSYQRFLVETDIPGAQSTTLSLNDPFESWKQEGMHLELYPLPNSSRAFHPVLRNNTPDLLEASLEIGILQGPVEVIPSHLLSKAEWQAFSNDLPPLVPLQARRDIQLSPNQEVALGLVPPQPAPGETEELEDSQPEFKRITPYGLLFVVREKGTGRTNLHHVGVTPQRPSRIVEPSLDYEAKSGKLTVRLRAKVPQSLPRPNLRFHVELQTNAGEVYSKGDIWLDRVEPSSKLELFAPRGRFHVLIDMEEYERAFRFSLSSEVSVQNYKTPSQFLGVRIDSPLPGTIFPTPIPETTVSLKVDAPPGAFPYPWNSSDFLEVGVDKNLDRRLEGDAVVRLRSDRQVSSAIALVEDGFQVINTVRDFRIRVPTDRMINGEANVLARMVSGNRSCWSEPIPVLFDGEAPRAETILLPSKAIQGKPLLISIFPESEQLSKISQVEVLIDESRLGIIDEDSKPVLASQSQGNGWQAELDVSKLALGAYDVLVRLRDEAGNIGDLQRVPVQVVPPIPDAISSANNLTGKFVYRQRPIPNGVVNLFPVAVENQATGVNETSSSEEEPAASVKTDALGRFFFENLSPGTYQLRAKSTIKNRPRIARQDVTVRAKPAAATSAVLEAK
ncbi:MAG: carboxypeptidase-like regulatory domain-containing protein [Planctomycetota bacterium]|nr:carboxypeptidase-like regulatory domain-containing protein [Planctomycetota bacterium]